MPRINVPPTRSSLLRVKKDLRFAREGYEILDRKREQLTSELIPLAHDAEMIQQEVWKLMTAAYRALGLAKLTMGQERVEWAALSVHKTVDVQLKYRGIMGVSIPGVEAHGGPPEMPYSLGETSAALDEASQSFRAVLGRLPELAGLVTSVWRLAGELRKTQRRVNALQYIFIPEYEETVTYIQSVLEEREREDVFRLKLLKNRTTKKAAEKLPESPPIEE
jgi:V/A-type H+/Na+-transporting ATPase subunit D